MNTPSEHADRKVSQGLETFAPRTDSEGALNNGRNRRAEPTSDDQSPGKHRFMTALLDKLRLNGTPSAAPDHEDGATQSASDEPSQSTT
ncbi:MAG: hypothetical protein ACR2NZ_01825, partial [Rubripirellula sp.]